MARWRLAGRATCSSSPPATPRRPRRLRSTLREEDALARLNSDEFAIIQTGIHRPEDAVLLARRLLDAIGETFLLDGHSVVIGASIGIAMAPGDGDESERLLKNADMALSRAKNDTRGTFSFFAMPQAVDHQRTDAWSVEGQVKDVTAGRIVMQRMLADADASVRCLVAARVKARQQHRTTRIGIGIEYVGLARHCAKPNALGAAGGKPVGQARLQIKAFGTVDGEHFDARP